MDLIIPQLWSLRITLLVRFLSLFKTSLPAMTQVQVHMTTIDKDIGLFFNISPRFECLGVYTTSLKKIKKIISGLVFYPLQPNPLPPCLVKDQTFACYFFLTFPYRWHIQDLAFLGCNLWHMCIPFIFLYWSGLHGGS